jgi:multidrug resistance efflux pump
MKVSMTRFVLPIVALSMSALGFYHVQATSQREALTAPPEEPARVPYEHCVAAAGLVEAQTENIAIGSALPGMVQEVFVPVEKVGQRVRAGDPLFRVDDRALRAQLGMQEANLAAAEAQLAKLDAMPRPEELPPSEAKVRVAQANVRLQLDLAERGHRLLTTRAMSEEEVIQRQLTLEVARQQLAQAKADYDLLKAGAWRPDRDIAAAAVVQARALVEQTKTELERSVVRAPVDGDVLQVNVRPGEYVGTPPNQALLVLGSIHELHVRADIDEHDIPRYRRGAPAKATVRGHPEISFPLRFVRVEPYVVPKKSLTGDNTERVDTRVLQVIYAIEKADEPLYVGQQLDVFIQAAAPAARR